MWSLSHRAEVYHGAVDRTRTHVSKIPKTTTLPGSTGTYRSYNHLSASNWPFSSSWRYWWPWSTSSNGCEHSGQMWKLSCWALLPRARGDNNIQHQLVLLFRGPFVPLITTLPKHHHIPLVIDSEKYRCALHYLPTEQSRSPRQHSFPSPCYLMHKLRTCCPITHISQPCMLHESSEKITLFDAKYRLKEHPVQSLKAHIGSGRAASPPSVA